MTETNREIAKAACNQLYYDLKGLEFGGDPMAHEDNLSVIEQALDAKDKDRAALLDLVRRMKYRLVHALDCYGVGTGQPDACTCGTKELLSEAAKRLASDEGTSARVLEGKS